LVFRGLLGAHPTVTSRAHSSAFARLRKAAAGCHGRKTFSVRQKVDGLRVDDLVHGALHSDTQGNYRKNLSF